MNKRVTKRKSSPNNSIHRFPTVSSMSSDSIVKGIIDDIIKTAVKTAENGCENCRSRRAKNEKKI